MLNSLRDSFEMLRDQVWFFRVFVILGVICIYRVLLHYVLRSNHCANPFCSKCIGSGSVRGRAISRIKSMSDDDDDDNDQSNIQSIALNNLLQHERLCQKNDEKPTIYFHRGLSSENVTFADEKILLDHYDEIRQEIVKFFQNNDNIKWTHLYLFQNGSENKANCMKFPKLFQILHLLPNSICVNNLNCLFGNCFITRLTSTTNKFDENRFGSSNCCIRMHMGLICDSQSPAYVLVNKKKRLMIENKRAIFYNNAIDHSVENPSENQQIFLTIDLWHHDLSPNARLGLSSIFHTDLA